MKKIVVFCLAISLMFTLSATVIAADTEINDTNSSSTQDVTASYNAAEETEKIYQVDITWGSMEFVYNEAYQGVWNPETHVYENATEGGWTCEVDANKVTVTNHSNDSIVVKMENSIKTEYQSTIAEMYWTNENEEKIISLALGNADNGLGVNGAGKETSGVMYLNLSGTMNETSGKTTIGTVTVTLQEK